jgi:hypothetical protein
MKEDARKPPYFLITLAGFTLVTMSAIGFDVIRDARRDYECAYRHALVEYAHTNNCKAGRATERAFNIEFRKYVIREHGARFTGDDFVDKRGDDVPIPTLTQWLNEYNPTDLKAYGRKNNGK